jgi:penicillin-binding protein 2
MVSAPSFDPNLLVGRKNVSKYYPKLINDENKPLFPRPTQAEYPPGSIFKLVQSLVGLQEGVIKPNTGFPCNKSLVGCHNHPAPNSIARAVQYSCNPYFYYAVKKVIQQGKEQSKFKDAALGLDLWERYMQSFGFGKKLNSDLTGLRSGIIPNTKFYNKWYGKNRWAFSTIRSIAIGQGEVKMTPLHMANLAVIMANRGWYYDPHFAKKIGAEPLLAFQKNTTMIDKKHFEPVISGMWRVVNEDAGTARRAQIEGIDVCGKTGTVQNPHGEDHSVFIAFAPKENPQIAIAVIVENAGFGGTWAAPIASLMIEKYLQNTCSSPEKESRVLKANLMGQ